MQPIIEQNLQQLKETFSTHGVERAYLFGSVCTPQFNQNSDVDVIVKFKDGLDIKTYSDYYFDLAEKLEKIFNRRVDLLTERSLKNPYFIEEINETKTLIYG